MFARTSHRNTIQVLPFLALIATAGCDAPSDQMGPSDPTVEQPDDVPADEPGQSDSTRQPSGESASMFVPSSAGCSMAHCDPQMSDQAMMPAPSPDSAIVWKDTEAAGSNFALGCVSNGERVACSFGGNLQPGPYLKAYDSHGAVLWTSLDPDTGLDRLNRTAFASAPMIDDQGGVIAVDNSALIRFDEAGNTVWSTPQTGGLPISPGITDDGIIVLGTNTGVVSAYDSSTGEVLGTLVLDAVEAGRAGTYVTRNSPAVWGDTVFISTEFELEDGSADPLRHAKLFALQVPAEPGEPFVEQWSYGFGSRSGATPVITDGAVIFDGDRPEPCTEAGPSCDEDEPHFFALSIADGAERWKRPIPNPSAASAVADPRGGVWVFGVQESVLRHFAAADGAETIVDAGVLSGHPEANIASAMTMSEDEDGTPVLTFTQGGPELTVQRLTSIVLGETPELRFSVRFGVGPRDWSAAQLPIVVTPQGAARIVLPKFGGGVVAIGD